MKPFTTLTSIVAPLPRDNVDTDAIIPSREMTSTSKTGLADGLFAPWRYINAAARTPNPNFVLNQPEYHGAQILASGANFGCGSSREHAAWAMADLGISAVIAPSFSDIFSGNAFKNGLLAIVLPQAAIDRLMEVARTDDIHIDLETQTVTTPFQDRIEFEIDPFRKHCLINGVDEIGLTLKSSDAISVYEAKLSADRPWLAPNPV